MEYGIMVRMIRYPDFRTITRSRTLAEHTDLATDLAHTGGALLAAVDLEDGVRLLGLSIQQLDHASEIQGALAFGDDQSRDESPDESEATRRHRGDLERSVDKVRARYGNDAVLPARLMREPGDRRS